MPGTSAKYQQQLCKCIWKRDCVFIFGRLRRKGSIKQRRLCHRFQTPIEWNLPIMGRILFRYWGKPLCDGDSVSTRFFRKSIHHMGDVMSWGFWSRSDFVLSEKPDWCRINSLHKVASHYYFGSLGLKAKRWPMEGPWLSFRKSCLPWSLLYLSTIPLVLAKLIQKQRFVSYRS